MKFSCETCEALGRHAVATHKAIRLGMRPTDEMFGIWVCESHARCLERLGRGYYRVLSVQQSWESVS
jgi:hypothetical protein